LSFYAVAMQETRDWNCSPTALGGGKRLHRQSFAPSSAQRRRIGTNPADGRRGTIGPTTNSPREAVSTRPRAQAAPRIVTKKMIKATPCRRRRCWASDLDADKSKKATRSAMTSSAPACRSCGGIWNCSRCRRDHAFRRRPASLPLRRSDVRAKYYADGRAERPTQRCRPSAPPTSPLIWSTSSSKVSERSSSSPCISSARAGARDPRRKQHAAATIC